MEITTEPHLTKRGHCIIGVNAEYGLQDIPSNIKKALSTEKGRGKLTIRVQGQTFTVEGRGSSGLAFTNPKEIVVRKSGFVSDRTLMVYANKAANDIPRRMVKLLQNPTQTITIKISANP